MKNNQKNEKIKILVDSINQLMNIKNQKIIEKLENKEKIIQKIMNDKKNKFEIKKEIELKNYIIKQHVLHNIEKQQEFKQKELLHNIQIKEQKIADFLNHKKQIDFKYNKLVDQYNKQKILNEEKLHFLLKNYNLSPTVINDIKKIVPFNNKLENLYKQVVFQSNSNSHLHSSLDDSHSNNTSQIHNKKCYSMSDLNISEIY